MNKIFFLVFALMAFHARGQKVFYDNSAEERVVPEFHSLEISNAFDLQLSQGPEAALAVSAPGAEARRRIATEVENGVLKISYGGGGLFGGGKARVYVSAPVLKHLAASGACDITINGEMKISELAVELSGACDLKGRLNGESLRLNLSGASDITMSGKVVNLHIDASGASHVRSYDLQTDNCVISASGVSDVRITVNKALIVDASGATKVHYRGEGTVTGMKTSGASKISKKD